MSIRVDGTIRAFDFLQLTMTTKRLRKRVKLRCLVCRRVFDDDYRDAHNRRYHSNLLSKNVHIGFETSDAAANPFELAKQNKNVSVN